MTAFDDDFLRDVGLEDLPSVEKSRFLTHVEDTLHKRIGSALAAPFTYTQLQEFQWLLKRSGRVAALKWLEANCPNYKQVASNHLEALREELRASAGAILTASGVGKDRPVQADLDE